MPWGTAPSFTQPRAQNPRSTTGLGAPRAPLTSDLPDPSSLCLPQPEGRTGGRAYFKPGPRVPLVTMEIRALRKETATRSHPPHRSTADPSRTMLMQRPWLQTLPACPHSPQQPLLVDLWPFFPHLFSRCPCRTRAATLPAGAAVSSCPGIAQDRALPWGSRSLPAGLSWAQGGLVSRGWYLQSCITFDSGRHL